MSAGQVPGRPMRRIGRGVLQRVDDHRLDDVVTDRACRPRTGSVDKTIETVGGKAVPPLRHRRWMAAFAQRDFTD